MPEQMHKANAFLQRNRQPPDGYRLSRVAFKDGQPVEPSTSTTAAVNIMQNGNLGSCPNSCFRPTGLAWDSKDRLFMTSDTTGVPYAFVSLYHGGSPSKSQHPSYHPLCQSKCTKLTPFFKGIANHLTDTASPASHSRTANPSSHQPAPQPPSTSCRTAIWAAVPTAVSALRAWRGIAKIACS